MKTNDNIFVSIVSRLRFMVVTVVQFYITGFREMTLGRTLWAMIILKLIILFFVFKLLFFPDILKRDYDTDDQRAQAVRTRLINR